MEIPARMWNHQLLCNQTTLHNSNRHYIQPSEVHVSEVITRTRNIDYDGRKVKDCNIDVSWSYMKAP